MLRIGVNPDVSRFPSLDEIPFERIAESNTYDVLCPMTPWFPGNPDYVVQDHFENNQHLRLRYYRNKLLTPVIPRNDPSMQYQLSYVKRIMSNLPLYQPYYPETYFSTWQLLHTLTYEGCKMRFSKTLFMGEEKFLGTLESIMMFNEAYNLNYRNHQYHVWLPYEEMISFSELRSTQNLRVDYLGQSFHNYAILSEISWGKGPLYHTIVLDMMQQNEEMYLQKLLSYLFFAGCLLRIHGTIIIRTLFMGSKRWNAVFTMMKCYRLVKTYRSDVVNCFNPEVYLVFQKEDTIVTEAEQYMMASVYHKQFYKIGYLGVQEEETSKEYFRMYREWAKKCQCALNMYPDWTDRFNQKKINTFVGENRLLRIRDLKDTYSFGSFTQVLGTGKSNKTGLTSLLKLKAKLNAMKRVMDTKPSRIFTSHKHNKGKPFFITWDQLTAKTDPLNDLKYMITKNYDGEMVSNAWLKMYEMIHLFPELIKLQGTWKSFHLCEAPGAFISAVNHHLPKDNVKWEWYAQTLRGSDALDDYFNLIEMFPNKWIFGPNDDSDGDISNSSIIRYYAGLHCLQDIDLITSDVGKPCIPSLLNEQESTLARVHLGQVTAVLACLKLSGNAVMKAFIPLCEPLTICLMNILLHAFHEVHLCKPSSSCSHNSEVYLICLNYKGVKESLLENLYGLLDDPESNSETIVKGFDDGPYLQSLTPVMKLIELQILSLQRNFFYYYHMDLIPQIRSYSDRWIDRNKVIPLRESLIVRP